MTAAKPPPGDRVRVTAQVAVDVADAFEVFTAEIDRWWRRGPRYRASGAHRGFLCIEPRVGGRLYESFETEAATRVVEVGRVKVWEPPSRLVFSWRNENFAPDESTEVEVRFEPCARGTNVTVEHRGLAALRPDHPARHGLQGTDFTRMLGEWWAALLPALREYAAEKRASRA